MLDGESMKDKHLAIRIQQCLALAEASNCPRRTFGALLVDPKRNVVLMEATTAAPEAVADCAVGRNASGTR